MRRAVWLAGAALVATLVAGCGGGSPSESSGSSTPTSATDETTASSLEPTSPEASTTVLSAAIEGVDDLDGDGEPDPVCSTEDFGAGLLLRIPCIAAGYAHEPTEGTTPVPGSAYGLPGLDLDLTGISAHASQARDEKGQKVVMFFINSDTLFDVGSSTLSGPAMDTFDGLARVIGDNWPAARVQVRGHTDGTGSAAGNQTLSEQRAAAVAAYLATKGIDGSRLTSVGLGSSVPVVLETNPDGTDNSLGRHDNRRVELVVRIP